MSEEEFDFNNLYKLGDVVYYLRVMPNLGINEIIELKLRVVKNDYIIGACCKTKQSMYINFKSKDLVYKDRMLAVKESKKYHVRKVTTDASISDEE